MKVFISWSGKKSQAIASEIKTLISGVIQAVKPFMSTEIEKGSDWKDVILDESKSAKLGILVLTQDNFKNEWILFEAGLLLGKVGNNKLCPILVDISKSEIKDPIAKLQMTSLEKEEMRKLIHSINNELENKLEMSTLEKAFNLYWIQFETSIKNILNNTEYTTDKKKKRTDSDMLEEILMLLRQQRLEERRNDFGNKSPVTDRYQEFSSDNLINVLKKRLMMLESELNDNTLLTAGERERIIARKENIMLKLQRNKEHKF